MIPIVKFYDATSQRETTSVYNASISNLEELFGNSPWIQDPNNENIERRSVVANVPEDSIGILMFDQETFNQCRLHGNVSIFQGRIKKLKDRENLLTPLIFKVLDANTNS